MMNKTIRGATRVVLLAGLIVNGQSTHSWGFEDQHDVQFIVSALQSPIPPEAIAQARAMDDRIMSVGEAQGQKVYLVTDQRAQALNALVQRLLAAMGQGGRDWVVRVLDTQPPTINAFVFGGKYIYVYTGLLKEATSVDELAVVLGHELGHSLLKHQLRRQEDTTNTLAGVADIIGALAGGKKGAEQVGSVTKAIRASYSRTDEEEADALGVAIARRAGFEPLRGADFFSRMARRAQEDQAKAQQQFSQLRGVTEQALAQCQQWVAAAKSNPLNRNRAQAICNDAEQKRLFFNQQVAHYQGGQRAQQLYGDHPSNQNRIVAIAALTDYVYGRRDLNSLQQFQQSYRVMVALNQIGSPLLKRPDGTVNQPTDRPSEARVPPAETPSNPLSEGRTIFNGKNGACFVCHGIDGDGKRGLNDRVALLSPHPSNLRDANALRFKTSDEIFNVIKNGIKGTGMVAARDRLTDQEIWQVVDYVHELRGDSGRQMRKEHNGGVGDSEGQQEAKKDKDKHQLPGDPAWLDRQRILDESKYGQHIKSDVQSFVQERQQQISAEEEKLKGMKGNSEGAAYKEELQRYQTQVAKLKAEVQAKKKAAFDEFNAAVTQALGGIPTGQVLSGDQHGALVAIMDQDFSRKTEGRQQAHEQLKRSEKSMAEQLADLKNTREQGLITEEEYQVKRKQIIERF